METPRVNAGIPKLIIQVAITGADTVPSQSPYVPITPEQIVAECYACWKAGAAMVHLHVREPEDGKPAFRMDLWEEVLTKVKARCGDLIIGVTTGGLYGLSPDERLEIVTRFRPEVASFTPESVSLSLRHIVRRLEGQLKEEWEREALLASHDLPFVNSMADITRFAETMRANGTRPEVECFSASGIYNARYLIREGFLDKPVWCQWVLGAVGGTGAYPSEVVHLEEAARRHIGEGDFQWSVAGIGYPRQYTLGALAIGMFGHVRVGLEDNIYRRPGVLATSNLEMVEDVKVLAEMFGRELASPDEAREMLALKGADQVAF